MKLRRQKRAVITELFTYFTADSSETRITFTDVSIDLVRTVSLHTGRAFTFVYICVEQEANIC